MEKEFWPVVYTRGLYPNWDIRWGDYNQGELPKANLYLYGDKLQIKGNDFMSEFYQKHQRAFKEMERING